MPKEAGSTFINKVKELSEEKLDTIGKDCCDQYDIDMESRVEWEDKRDKWYKLWMCHREEKNTPWPGASNVCLPLLATATNQFHGRSYQSIFSAPGLVKALPVGPNDVKRAKNVESFMNWQTLYQMEEYEEVFDKVLQLIPINGLANKKLYWSRTEKRPMSEYVSALDLVLPYGTKDLKSARRIAHRLWRFYDQIKERESSGMWILGDEFPETPDKEQDSNLEITADEATGVETEKKEERPHLFLEVHKKIDIGDGMKPYTITVHYDTQRVVRLTEREIDGKEIHNFIDYHFLPNPEGYYSFGFGHFLEPLIEMGNTAFNQIFDAGRISNQPFGFYGRRAGIKSRKIKLHPGIMTEVEDAKQVYFPSMQRVDQVLFQILGLIQQYMEQFTSTSDYIQGRESKGTKTPTASGTLAIIEQGLVTFAVMTKRIFRSLRTELRYLMALNQLHMPDSFQYRIMEQTDQIAFPEIKRKEFDGVHDVMPLGDPSYASKLTRRQESIELYQMLMTNPLIVGNPETGEGFNAAAVHEITSDVIETYGKRNKNKILPPMPEPPVDPIAENAMFMQGDYVSPKPGENHPDHLGKHGNFLETEFFGSMSAEYKDLVLRHIQETEQILYMEMAQQTQLGG
jgi:hypothetical protein